MRRRGERRAQAEEGAESGAEAAFLLSLAGERISVYVALTNIPEGELLTGFAMRSDPNVAFGICDPRKFLVGYTFFSNRAADAEAVRLQRKT